MTLEAASAIREALHAPGPDRMCLMERTDIGCVLLTACVDGADARRRAGLAVGIALPEIPGGVKSGGGRTALWLAPRSWLALCKLDDEERLVRGIVDAFPSKAVLASRYSDHLCWLELLDRGSTDILLDGGFVSLERSGVAVGRCKRTLIAGAIVVLIRLGSTSWLIGVERSRAEYFAAWLSKVGTRSHL